MLRFEVDIPPPLSQLYTNVPGKGRVNTALYRKYAAQATHDIGMQLLYQKRRFPSAPYALEIWIYLKNNRRTDADNRAKAAQDVLAKALCFDDSKITDVCTRKRVIRELDRERCFLLLGRSTGSDGPLGKAQESLLKTSLKAGLS
jgi:Holliday junction resolvase RusA-like endonuclease